MKKTLPILSLLLCLLLTFGCSQSTSPDVLEPEPETKKSSDIFTVSCTNEKKYSCARIDLSENIPYMLHANFEGAQCQIKKECVAFPNDFIYFNGTDFNIPACETVLGTIYEDDEFPCKWDETKTSISKVAVGIATDSISKRKCVLLKFVTNYSDPVEKNKVWGVTFLANVEKDSKNAYAIKDIYHAAFSKELRETIEK